MTTTTRKKAPAKKAPRATPSGLAISRKLAVAIRREFKAMRLAVKVSSTSVSGTQFRRVHVIAPVFSRMDFMERQDLVWRIAEEALSYRELLKITMIQTLRPSDVRK